jgi:hypothetical protein
LANVKKEAAKMELKNEFKTKELRVNPGKAK